MYVVNAQTLEFDCSKMVIEEQIELENFVIAIVRVNYTYMEHPAFVIWCQAGNLENVDKS